MTRRWVVGDVETTGFKQPAGIVEIAWVEIDEDFNVLEEVSSLIDPEREIEPGASGVHRITAKDVADAPTISEFFEFVLERPNIEGDVVLIAHNSAYDRAFFAPLCENYLGDIDTVRLARLYYPNEQNHKLDTLRYSLGLDLGDAHRAMGDVVSLLSLLRKMRDEHGLTLEGAFARRDEPVMLSSLTFGIHRDKPIREVPKEYLQWMVRKGDFAVDVLYTARRVLAEVHGVEA